MAHHTQIKLAIPAGSQPAAQAPRQQLGEFGELLVVQLLQQRGHTVLSRNWRHPAGELDIVALIRGRIAAIEVKTRRGTGYGKPLEAVSAAKLQRLQRLLQLWQQEHPEHAKKSGRIDIAGVLLSAAGAIHITYLLGVSDG